MEFLTTKEAARDERSVVDKHSIQGGLVIVLYTSYKLIRNKVWRLMGHSSVDFAYGQM